MCVFCAQRQSCEGCQSTPCAWGVLCGVRVVRSHAPEPRARSLFSLTARVCSKTKQHTEHPRQHAAVVHKTHGGVIDSASAPCQDSAARLCRPSAASRWHGIAARAMPLERYQYTGSSLVWHKPSVMRCAYIRDADYAGFLLMRCVHSPGTTRILLANKIIVPIQTPKNEPNPKNL